MVLEVAPRTIVHQAETLGLSRLDLALAVGASPRTVERWLAGSAYPQYEGRERLQAFAALYQHVLDTFIDIDAARTWLHAPARYLGNLTPAEALRAGRLDRVEAALEALDSGVFV